MEFITINQLLKQNAEKYGEQIAFQMRGNGAYRRFNFRQVQETAQRLTEALAGYGVGRGDRVALVSENRPEWAIAFLAITAMGAVAVPLDAMLCREEILPLIKDAEPKAIVLSQKYLEYTQGTGVEGRKVLMEEFKHLPPGLAPGDNKVDLEDLASIVYTSGTTGAPKGVMLTHRNIMSNVMTVASLFDIGPKDNFLSVLPLHHTFETTAGFLGPFYKGCAITYAESLKSYNLLKNMQETGATIMCGVPLLYQLFYEGILREAEEKKLKRLFDILFSISRFSLEVIGANIGRRLFSTVHKKFGGRIRFFVTGGAASDPEILRNFERMGFTVLQGYGLTESAPVLSCCTLKSNKIGSVGKPIPGVEIKIAGEEPVGEILAFGPNIMQGYYKRKDLTGEVINKDGWLHTGDVGYLDDEGFLFITGRCKDVIVTASGVNVYPEEIEFLLKRIPAIKESCVLGSKVKEGVRKGTEEVVAVVVPQEGFSEEIIKEAVGNLNKRMAEYKKIAHLVFHREELPKTRLLKVKKFALRKELGL